MRVKRTNSLPIEACIKAAQTCACFNLRKAARVVTRIYDDGLRPTGLSSGQFVILLAAQIHGSATIRELAGTVGVDRTVLSRNLKPLLARKLLRAKSGLDRRTRCISLTPSGRAKLTRAYPVWETTQADFAKKIGRKDLKNMLDQTQTIYNRLTSQGQE